MATAWLIGAGFSYELGMPLVWELTGELRSWLTGTKLRELARGWAAHRNPTSRAVVEAVANRLDTIKDEHYEQLIAWMQTERRRVRAYSRDYDRVIGFVQDTVAHLLYLRHSRNRTLHRLALPWYRGLASAVPADAPLWVFSLNHDLCVELLASELGIPISCGYPEHDAVSFATTAGHRLSFDLLPRSKLTALDLSFDHGRVINLVKLHGSLDVFGFNDHLDYVRLHPRDNSSDAWLDALDDVQTRLAGTLRGKPMDMIGEITVDDDTGVVQFLRRTVVAGGFKFDGRGNYNAPGELIEFFARKLEDFDELVIIGYSWCDAHINAPIEKWVAAKHGRRIRFMNPSGLPGTAHTIEPHTDTVAMNTGDFLAQYAPAVTSGEQAQRELQLIYRKDPGAKNRFKDVLRAVAVERMLTAREELLRAEDPATFIEALRNDPTLAAENLLRTICERLRQP